MRSHSKLESKFANRAARRRQAECAGFAVKVEFDVETTSSWAII